MTTMNHRQWLATTMAIVLGFSTFAATAQPRDQRDHRDERGGRHEQQGDRGGPGRPDRHPGNARGHEDRGQGPKAQIHGHARGHVHGGRGIGPEHRYHRGDHLPPNFRTRHYIVEDWRGHRLSSPPRGYRWVQVDADYVLIAVATGLIAQIVLSN